jgi:hypothetical protein
VTSADSFSNADGLVNLRGQLVEAVTEFHSGDHLGQRLKAPQAALAKLGTHAQLVDRAQHAVAITHPLVRSGR